MVIIVGTHLDFIPQSDHKTLIRRYEQLILQYFSKECCEDLPNGWPKIASIHFVGLIKKKRFLDLLVNELRDDIYDTALNLDLPLGVSVCLCVYFVYTVSACCFFCFFLCYR